LPSPSGCCVEEGLRGLRGREIEYTDLLMVWIEGVAGENDEGREQIR